jgi:glycine betaine catabolism B
MSHLRSQKTDWRRILGISVFAVIIGLLLTIPAQGQVTPEEHAKHHPGQSGGTMPAAATPTSESDPAPPGTSGGMDMGKMMNDMGKAPPRELYPTLMSLQELTPKQREEVRIQAKERIRLGAALLSKGLDRLGEAAGRDDYAAMHDATARMREALAAFESGVAAQQALTEGKPPRQIAMQWFKSEMNLQPPLGVEARGGVFGVTPFHFFTMVLLIAFALAMVAMYFFKMRRAAALFGRIETDSGSPPPGSAPPLVADTKVPSA